MPDNVFPLEPPHFLASGPDLSKSHCLLLYRGRMTGRWFDVTNTRVPGPRSTGSREPVTFTKPQVDVVGFGKVTLQLSPDPPLTPKLLKTCRRPDRCVDAPDCVKTHRVPPGRPP